VGKRCLRQARRRYAQLIGRARHAVPLRLGTVGGGGGGGGLGAETPGDDVGGVQGDAEEIGGDEAELGGAHADDADDGAVDSGDDPALPELFAEKDGAENGEDAGQVVQADGVKQIQHSLYTRHG
jgi:hypothetical protein